MIHNCNTVWLRWIILSMTACVAIQIFKQHWTHMHIHEMTWSRRQATTLPMCTISKHERRGCLKSGNIYQLSTKPYKIWHKIPTGLVESCAIIIWKNESWDNPSTNTRWGKQYLQNRVFRTAFWKQCFENTVVETMLFLRGSGTPDTVTGCHVKDPIALRHTLSDALPIWNWEKTN